MVDGFWWGWLTWRFVPSAAEGESVMCTKSRPRFDREFIVAVQNAEVDYSITTVASLPAWRGLIFMRCPAVTIFPS
ncbi:hypothetical protein [Catellatospora sp. NPDC049609]|uniref:hypothetical protein n=1 Tax=Catellatospora sp. NPDC049609 TaxID=3155505 RepID=UPI0034352C15